MPGTWIDVCDSTLAPLGAGPITTAPSVSITRRLDRAGEMRLSVPAVDPRAALIAAKRILRAYTLRAGVLVNAGDGIIDSITIAADAQDSPMLDIAGADLLGELGNRLVGALELSDGAGGPVAVPTALAAILAFAPAGWTIDTTTFPATGSTIYLKLQNETVLGALGKVAGNVGEHFRLGTGRQVVWLGTAQPNSGIRAVMRGDTLALRANPNVCIITSLSEVRDSHDAATRIYARGGGNETAGVTLQQATAVPPPGYSRGSDTLGWYLKHDASDTANRIEASVSFKDIAVLSGHAGAPAAASNQLQAATLTYLQGHLPTAPQQTYRLTVTGLSRAVQPGDLVTATYRKVVGSYVAVDINALVVALETTTALTAQGVETVAMVVSTVAAWPASDGEVLSQAVDTVLSLDRHLQKAAQATQADTAKAITGSALTVGSVPFIGAGGALVEDTSNLVWDDTNNRLGIGTNAPSSPLDINVLDAGTTTQVVSLLTRHRSSGTPAVGFGSTVRFQAETDTHANANQFDVTTTWQTPTNAAQKGRVQLFVYDTAAREFLRGEASGSAAMIGFLGAAASVRQAGGAATAGAAYTATEQAMLQKVYDALRLFGLLA